MTINCLVMSPGQAALYMSFGGNNPIIVGLLRDIGNSLSRSRPGGSCAICSAPMSDVAINAAAMSITYSTDEAGETDETLLIGFICEPCCDQDDGLIDRCRTAALSQFPIQFFHMTGSIQ